MSVDKLVTPPDDITELAAWYAEYHERIEQVSRTWRAAQARLRDYIKDNAPVGRVGLSRAGYDWPDEAVTEVFEHYPNLFTTAALKVIVERDEADVTAQPTAMQRVRECAELVMEFEPRAVVTWDLTLDKRQANALIEAGGEAGQFLAKRRSTNWKLRVT